MSCQTDFEICTCDCHTDAHVYHVMPCCSTCPYCGENIQRAFYHEHKKRCKNETDNLLNQLGEAIGGYSSNAQRDRVREVLFPGNDDIETILVQAREMVQESIKERSSTSK